MKTKIQLFGYPIDAATEAPLQLSEVSLVVGVTAMRNLADFLLSCADEIDRKKTPYGPDTHFHLRDFLNDGIEADVIIVPVLEKR